MKVKVFKITGEMWTRGGRQKVYLEKTGVNEKEVLERVLSELGSRHKLKRKLVRIKEIAEINLDEVRKPLIKELLSLNAIVVRGRRR